MDNRRGDNSLEGMPSLEDISSDQSQSCSDDNDDAIGAIKVQKKGAADTVSVVSSKRNAATTVQADSDSDSDSDSEYETDPEELNDTSSKALVKVDARTHLARDTTADSDVGSAAATGHKILTRSGAAASKKGTKNAVTNSAGAAESGLKKNAAMVDNTPRRSDVSASRKRSTIASDPNFGSPPLERIPYEEFQRGAIVIAKAARYVKNS
ncbi:uncharacterized protein LOC109792742 [Cajanus cajan]|uniref:uncharacterized protein LOC109792742 n=1 Tax=Cajanus cajan TaxID=3821 RepID=UPI00098DC027|nr:uncharacterized protein LOC109792742 [Cajanus cajan]